MPPKEAVAVVGRVVSVLIACGGHRAVKYLSPKLVVRASRTLDYHTKDRMPRKNQNVSITLTIGRPNLLERKFIKDCQWAGEPFPVKNVIVRTAPKPRVLKKRR